MFDVLLLLLCALGCVYLDVLITSKDTDTLVKQGYFYHGGNLFWVVSRKATDRNTRHGVAMELLDHQLPAEHVIKAQMNERDALCSRLRILSRHPEVAKTDSEASAVVRAAEMVRWLSNDDNDVAKFYEYMHQASKNIMAREKDVDESKRIG